MAQGNFANFSVFQETEPAKPLKTLVIMGGYRVSVGKKKKVKLVWGKTHGPHELSRLLKSAGGTKMFIHFFYGRAAGDRL